MLENIVAKIALALVSWLESRIERGNTAKDATTDRDTLRRGGTRLRLWLLKNRASK